MRNGVKIFVKLYSNFYFQLETKLKVTSKVLETFETVVIQLTNIRELVVLEGQMVFNHSKTIYVNMKSYFTKMY